MNGADLLCDALSANGVDVCLASSGTYEMHFVAALDCRPEMRCIPMPSPFWDVHMQGHLNTTECGRPLVAGASSQADDRISRDG
jgi:hypothetical protein